MADDLKLLKPETIIDKPFPNSEYTGDTTSVSASTEREILKTETIEDKPYPTQFIANKVISNSFNTQSKRILAEFQFSEMGAISIGQYEENVSGEVKISPTGIIAKNQLGETTFTLDGSTGDATFKGTIVAGSLIAGRTDIGTVGGNVFIDGENNRIIISDGTNNRILIGYHLNGF